MSKGVLGKDAWHFAHGRVDISKYTLPENETKIFASKYKLYLPSEEKD